MKYSPPGDKRPALAAFTLFLALTAVSAAMFANKSISPWIPQLSAVVFAVCAVQVYVKYILSEYKYAFDDRNLCIDKIVGKKIVPLGSLDLSYSLAEVMSKSEYNEKKSTLPKPDIMFNYCKTMRLRDPFVYLFEFNGKNALLTFEPNGEFVCALNAVINECLARKEEENTPSGDPDDGVEM